MALTKNDVLKVATLAKIPLTDEEINLFSMQLTDVLSYFNELNEIDTERTEPTHQTTGLTDVFREDTINDTRVLPVELAIGQSEKTYNNLFVVPRLIDDK